MKGLLLLLVFSPVILFGQMRQKAIADSIKAAATDINSVSEFISNNPGIKVDNIRVADSGRFATITIRVHITAPDVIAAAPTLPVVTIAIKEINTPEMSVVTVPALPPPVVDADTILPLVTHAVFKLDIAGTPLAMVEPVTVPPLPQVVLYAMDPLHILVVTRFRIENIAAVTVDTVTVPGLPDVVSDVIDAVPLCSAIEIAIKGLPMVKIDTATIPVFTERRMPVEGLHLSDDGYSLLEKLEGFSPEPYSLGDGGVTIGFGFFIASGGARTWDKGMTWEEAEAMLRQKVPTYEDQVKQYINVPLTQEDFDALTMLAYNLGGFSKATSLVNDINSEADYDKVQNDWKRFVHSKAPGMGKGLMNRRRDELDVRNTANYQPERKVLIYKNKK